MARRLSLFGLAALLLAGASGCRSCGDRCGGLFTSGHRSEPSGRLVSRGSCDCDGDAVGTPIPGYPVPVGPGGPGVPYPGGPIPTSPPNELPYPQPGGLIPPAGVPFAPPAPAPGDPSGTIGVTPGTSKGGVPVKIER